MNLIFGAFAVLEGYREGEQPNRGADSYYRCIVVSLASAKQQNPDCTVALVTNAPVPAPFDGQLAAAGVQVWRCPFEGWKFGADTRGRWPSTSCAPWTGCCGSSPLTTSA